MGFDKLVESLPEGLKAQFGECVVPFYGLAKRWAIAAVAVHLVGQGCGDVSFRKRLVTPEGTKFYVDVYCGERNLYVICLESTALWVSDRVDMIKRVDGQARVAVAVQDWLAWSAADMNIVADEVWAVDRDGAVLRLDEWLEKRRQLLKESAINAVRKLKELLRHYSEVKEGYEIARKAEQDICNSVSDALVRTAQALRVDYVDWLVGREYHTDREEFLNSLWAEIRLTRSEMLNTLLGFANKLLRAYTPYILSITEKGDIFVYRDAAAEQWLSWGSIPDPARATGLQKELAIIAEILENAEKSGETAPKENYRLLHFTRQKDLWPPQTVTVPVAILQEMLNALARMEKHVENLRMSRGPDAKVG